MFAAGYALVHAGVSTISPSPSQSHAGSIDVTGHSDAHVAPSFVSHGWLHVGPIIDPVEDVVVELAPPAPPELDVVVLVLVAFADVDVEDDVTPAPPVLPELDAVSPGRM
jgi:hypothetical protein